MRACHLPAVWSCPAPRWLRAVNAAIGRPVVTWSAGACETTFPRLSGDRSVIDCPAPTLILLVPAFFCCFLRGTLRRSDVCLLIRVLGSLQYHLRAKHPGLPLQQESSQKTQTTIDAYTARALSTTKEESIAQALVTWIVSSSRPLSIVEDDGLANVLKIASGSPCYQPPSRRAVDARVGALYNRKKSDVQAELSTSSFISLTADFWTSVTNDAYLGVTAHWIDDDWVLRSATLQVRHIPEWHAADQCASEILEAAIDWRIDANVVAVCTDNARKICLGVEKANFQNLKCAAHTLQLCVQKALSVTGVERLLAVCRRVVCHFKHSSSHQAVLSKHASDLGMPRKKLQEDIATRWNSTYVMINSLIELKEPLRRAMEDATDSKTLTPHITGAEWDWLEQLRDTLKPLLDVTELLEGYKYVTRSVLIPALKLLKNAMTTNGCDPAFICRFKAMLVYSVEERLLAWPHYSDYEVATSLDPRFKSLACIDRDRREHVWERRSSAGLLSRAATPAENTPSKKRKHHFVAENEEQITPCQVPLYRSMAEVADDDLDPLEWWRVQSSLLSELAPVVKMLLCVPVTSTPCERVFSTAAMTVNKKRNSLLPENVNKLLCLRNWMNYH
ncbi:hypothetical protein HPB48_013712 [Haemaphysalis longicornis]|uniref:HAT C-terminal dimerisation domain-containing protein n=1 Tax=Haemaphysalis longicornis TaxID=44386 RepID=A0A9J6GGD6_HAELO|nr:hypothetical protein HPB48_013712 [Haemaphysalis longicornis]